MDAIITTSKYFSKLRLLNSAKLIIALTLLLALTVSLSACGEGTVTEAVDMHSYATQATMSNTPTRKPSPTIPLYDTSTPNPTFDALDTAAAPFAGLCPEALYNPEKLSPNREWLLCNLGPEDMMVVNRNGARWEFSSGDSGIEYSGYIIPIHWSLDGQYLYFAPMYLIDGWYVFYNGVALLRVDLSSGDIQVVLPENPELDFYVLSISPTGRRLAYIYHDEPFEPVTITIRDLKTGEEKSIHLSALYTRVGEFSWSDDGLELTFSVHDQGIDQDYYLTYDVLSLALLETKAYLPNWKLEITAIYLYEQSLTPTPTP